MRRRGLAGTVARTAVIAGTATAVSGAVAGSQQQKAAAAQQAAAEQQAQAEAAAQQAAAQQQAQIEAAAQQAVADQLATQAPAEPAAAAPAPAVTDEMIAQLQKLGELRTAGVLSDEEFASLKAKLLNG
jgi:Short C-terminal domain